MSKLTEEQYEEYIRLLRVWVDAEKALERPDGADADAARRAYAALQSFRSQHGLDGAGLRVAEGVEGAR